MKKILLFTLASASVLAGYLLTQCACKNSDSNDNISAAPRERHLTKAFSNVKAHAQPGNESV